MERDGFLSFFFIFSRVLYQMYYLFILARDLSNPVTLSDLYDPKGAVTLRNVSCNLPSNVLATLWRGRLHETSHSVASYPAMAKIVAKQVPRALAKKRIKLYCSSKLSRNDFGCCRVPYTVKLFRATPTMSPKHCETSCKKHFTV